MFCSCMLPLETHALLLSFNSWALNFCRFLFCQLDKPSKHLGFTLVLDNTSFLILSLFNFLSSDLTLGVSISAFHHLMQIGTLILAAISFHLINFLTHLFLILNFGPILLLKTTFLKMWLSIKHWIFWEPHILHDMV